MSKLYEQCGGCTIISIKNHGDTFSYANASYGSQKKYFDTWSDLRPFMQPDRWYLIGATVSKTKDKWKLKPFGIAHEVDEETAKAAAKEHFLNVMHGAWDAEEEKTKLIKDWEEYQSDYLYAIRERATQMFHRNKE